VELAIFFFAIISASVFTVNESLRFVAMLSGLLRDKERSASQTTGS
jgi:hypothetical protein